MLTSRGFLLMGSMAHHIYIYIPYMDNIGYTIHGSYDPMGYDSTSESSFSLNFTWPKNWGIMIPPVFFMVKNHVNGSISLCCETTKQVVVPLRGWKVKRLRIMGSKLSMNGRVKTCCFSTNRRQIVRLSETGKKHWLTSSKKLASFFSAFADVFFLDEIKVPSGNLT